jgi:hypothetical protein
MVVHGECDNSKWLDTAERLSEVSSHIDKYVLGQPFIPSPVLYLLPPNPLWSSSLTNCWIA